MRATGKKIELNFNSPKIYKSKFDNEFIQATNPMFNREIDLEGCLQQYIESKLICSIPWGPRNFSRYPTCETKEQLTEYYKLVLKIRHLGERGIYEETGGKSSCHVNIYKLNKRFTFRDYSIKDQVLYFTNHQLF